MKRGMYRNKAGAELLVLWPIIAVREFKTLGTIYEAEARDPLFGRTPYLVTNESMADCGYELIEETIEL